MNVALFPSPVPMCVVVFNLCVLLASVQRLSPDCEDQIRVILQESALDYRLDPQLQMHCSDEVNTQHLFVCLLSFFKPVD